MASTDTGVYFLNESVLHIDSSVLIVGSLPSDENLVRLFGAVEREIESPKGKRSTFQDKFRVLSKLFDDVKLGMEEALGLVFLLNGIGKGEARNYVTRYIMERLGVGSNGWEVYRFICPRGRSKR